MPPNVSAKVDDVTVVLGVALLLVLRVFVLVVLGGCVVLDVGGFVVGADVGGLVVGLDVGGFVGPDVGGFVVGADVGGLVVGLDVGGVVVLLIGRRPGPSVVGCVGRVVGCVVERVGRGVVVLRYASSSSLVTIPSRLVSAGLYVLGARVRGSVVRSVGSPVSSVVVGCVGRVVGCVVERVGRGVVVLRYASSSALVTIPSRLVSAGLYVLGVVDVLRDVVRLVGRPVGSSSSGGAVVVRRVGRVVGLVVGRCVGRCVGLVVDCVVLGAVVLSVGRPVSSGGCVVVRRVVALVVGRVVAFVVGCVVGFAVVAAVVLSVGSTIETLPDLGGVAGPHPYLSLAQSAHSASPRLTAARITRHGSQSQSRLCGSSCSMRP